MGQRDPSINEDFVSDDYKPNPAQHSDEILSDFKKHSGTDSSECFPGTFGRMAMYARRYELGQELHRDDDPDGPAPIPTAGRHVGRQRR